YAPRELIGPAVGVDLAFEEEFAGHVTLKRLGDVLRSAAVAPALAAATDDLHPVSVLVRQRAHAVQPHLDERRIVNVPVLALLESRRRASGGQAPPAPPRSAQRTCGRACAATWPGPPPRLAPRRWWRCCDPRYWTWRSCGRAASRRR